MSQTFSMPPRSLVNAIVFPSGETSTLIHVPSLVSKEIFRASARGVLISAAGSFLFESEDDGSAARRGAAARTAARSRHPADVRMRAPFLDRYGEERRRKGELCFAHRSGSQ